MSLFQNSCSTPIPYPAPLDRLKMKEVENEHALHPRFEEKMVQIRKRYFSRDPKLWPIFKDPGVQRVLAFRLGKNPPEERFKRYKDSGSLLQKLKAVERVAETSRIPTAEENDEVLLFAASLVIEWEHPSCVENVASLSSDPALYGYFLGALANPNLVHRHYSQTADDLEHALIRQMVTLAGYDLSMADGIFTHGGTQCNLYGYLLGIRKSLPDSRLRGINGPTDYRMVHSQGGHYSNTTNLSVLGIDVSGKMLSIKMTDSNEMDLKDLEMQLDRCFALGIVVPCILLTMGTTDTFAVDRVKPVFDVRNRMCEKYDVDVRPHIHVDAAVGWIMLFFRGYDFDMNPIGVNDFTLQRLRSTTARFDELQYADSFSIDFHKWGYVPLLASLVLVKDKKDLKALENDPSNFTYFERASQGHSHLQSTIECSRSGAGLFATFSAMQYIGVEGYRTLIAHCLQNAHYFRKRLLDSLGHCTVQIGQYGPSVAFRLYNPRSVKDASQEYHFEHAFCMNSPNSLAELSVYHKRVDGNSRWHRSNFLRRQKRGLFSSWVESISHSIYNSKGAYKCFPGEKVVFMNPLTTRSLIDEFIDLLVSSIAEPKL